MGVLARTWGGLRSSWCWTPLCRILCILLHPHHRWRVLAQSFWDAQKIYIVQTVNLAHLNVYMFLCAEETWKETDKGMQRYLTDTHSRNSSYCIFINWASVSRILSALLSPSSECTCLQSYDKTLGKALWWFMRRQCCDVREWTDGRRGKTKCEAS